MHEAKLNEYTHASVDAYALQCARIAARLDQTEALEHIKNIIVDVDAMHEGLRPTVGAMYTHYGRHYEECHSLSDIEEKFKNMQYYLKLIEGCIDEGSVQEYLDDKIYPFCS